MSALTIFGFVAILTVPWFIPEIVQFARWFLLRRARGAGLGCASRPAPHFLIAHGCAARYDEKTITRVKDSLAR